MGINFRENGEYWVLHNGVPVKTYLEYDYGNGSLDIGESMWSKELFKTYCYYGSESSNYRSRESLVASLNAQKRQEMQWKLQEIERLKSEISTMEKEGLI